MVQVGPLLKDLLRNLNKFSNLPADYPPKVRIGGWHERLHNQPANYELQENEVRQLLFDLDVSYQEFRVSINA